jgi:hypothetical protein
VVDPLAPAQTGEHVRFFGPAVVRNDQENVFADRLCRGIAEESLGSGIPGRDDAVQRLADDGVIRGPRDSREPTSKFVALLLQGAARAGPCADDIAAIIDDRRHGQRNRDPAAILRLAHGVEPGNPLTSAHTVKHVLTLGAAELRADHRNVLADGLRCRISVKLLGGSIPEDDHVVGRRADNGVV